MMGREKIKRYRYTCDSLKRVTHAEDGREYGQPMVRLCMEEAVFEGVSKDDADAQAHKAGWVIKGAWAMEDEMFICPINEHPGEFV